MRIPDIAKKWLFVASLILFGVIVFRIVCISYLIEEMPEIYVNGSVSSEVSGSVDVSGNIGTY